MKWVDSGLSLSVRGHEEKWRDDSAASNTSDDQSGSTLRVLAETAHAEGDDGREDDGLEEEDDVEHGHAGVAAFCD